MTSLPQQNPQSDKLPIKHSGWLNYHHRRVYDLNLIINLAILTFARAQELAVNINIRDID